MFDLLHLFRRRRPKSATTDQEVSIAGLVVEDGCHQIRAAMLTTSGTGIDLKWTLQGSISMEIPKEIAEVYTRLNAVLRGGRHQTVGMTVATGSVNSRNSVSLQSAAETLSQLAWFGRRLAEFGDAALRRLLQRVGMPIERLLAAGFREPGLRGETEDEGWVPSSEKRSGTEDPHNTDNFSEEEDSDPAFRYCRTLADTAVLAELSGIPVIDDFAARDLAMGGRGDPLEPLADWTLLHHELRNRLVIDLRPATLRYTWLPKPRSLRVHRSVLVGETPLGTDPAQSVERLSQLVAASVPADLPIEEILLDTGDAAQDAETSFRGALSAHFPNSSTYSIRTLGVASDQRPACVAAILARFFLDRIPSNFPTLTGATAPRVLGRLTLGNAAATERVLRFMNGEPLAARSLRSAGN